MEVMELKLQTDADGTLVIPPQVPSELAVPDVLLAEAGIPQDADLQIVCLNGALLITQNTTLNETELAALLDGLYAANEIAAQLPDDESALDCLQNALKRAERERENA